MPPLPGPLLRFTEERENIPDIRLVQRALGIRGAASLLPLPARHERGEGWGEG